MNPRRIGLVLLVLAIPLAACGERGDSPRFDEAGYVRAGGIDHWVRVVGEDRSNPVLLMLHGGPGATFAPWVDLFRPWEKHFTLAYWDQRGAGKTFTKHGPAIADTITIERMTLDGIQIAEDLVRRYGQDRVILLGHSWGSLLGVEMARKRPDLFTALVGTGQVVNQGEGERIGYEEILRRATVAANAEAVKELTEIGPPPYAPTITLATERKWASELAHESEQKFLSVLYMLRTFPSDFPPADRKTRMEGFMFSNAILYGRERMDGAIMQVDLGASATEFQVPVYFFQGEFDAITPTILVKSYIEKIQAPSKRLELLPGDHNVLMALPDQFLALLLAHVRPTAR